MRFRHLTINEGLSLSSVYHISQDSKGFMWFGTEDGLNKYDGRTITVYGATTDQHMLLANKWIELVYEDRSGMIWLGSRGGLTMYNPRKEQFLVINHDPDDPASLSNDTISALIADLHNRIWVGTFNGLNRVNRVTGEVERIVPDDPGLDGLRSRINDFDIDRSGNLRIATERGLYSQDRKSGLFFNESIPGILAADDPVHCMTLCNSSLWLGTDRGLVEIDLGGGENHRLVSLDGENDRIQKLLCDRLGQVWLQTDKALYCYRGENRGLVRVLSHRGTNNSLALYPVQPLIEDSRGQLWHGSFGEGLFMINPSTLEYRQYFHNPADPSSLAENSINCIFEDRSGVMWFGTFGAGISILDPNANQFTLFKHNPFNRNSLASSFIWTICECSDSVLWVGSNAYGISCYDQKSKRFSHYNHHPAYSSSLSHPSVRKIYEDSRGRIWIGTDGGGLDLFRPQSGDFRHFRHREGDSTSISHNSVRAIYEDPKGRLWVGTRRGLNLFDPESGRSRRFLEEEFIYSAVYMDRNEDLWVGTYGGGLFRLNTNDFSIENYRNNADDPTTLSDNIVFAIHEDRMGRLWIGTNSGLNMFYPATGSFRRFGLDEGLANEVIYGVLPDDENRIWLSTNLGIIRFDLESFEVKNFNMHDGLQSNEFNGGAYHRGRSGLLYFGGVYGLNVLDPSSIRPQQRVPQVTLTKLEIMGREVMVAGIDLEEEFGEKPGSIIHYEGEYYSREHFTYMEELVLDYSQRFFSIEFSALNSRPADRLSYSYIMENLDEDWNEAGERNYVSYANMKAGSYVLKVRARNSDGYLSDPPLLLPVTITPPYWLSWWFILAEALVLTAIVIWIYNYLVKTRTNRLLRVQNQQIREANEALKRSERNLRELNATKDKFFSIVSHDLKNPFSSLLAISELMVENFNETDREDHRAGFRKINQSIRHLLDLLENLLTWSRSQRGRIKFEPFDFRLDNIIQENLNLHRISAEKKGITLDSEGDSNILVHGDRDMVNTIIRNLVTNAIKFTPRDKKVRIRTEVNDHTVRISVVDEGIGIGKDNLRRLFRIDEKYKSSGTEGEKGTGLGLIICREFVEMNQGEISVESQEGSGSTFSFTLPLAREDSVVEKVRG